MGVPIARRPANLAETRDPLERRPQNFAHDGHDRKEPMMELGLYTFAEVGPAQRMRNLLEEIELAYLVDFTRQRTLVR
jgi:hypothetical protein